MSTVLTSTPLRRCKAGRNRSIPTILTGRTGGGLVDVSAVDTGPLPDLLARPQPSRWEMTLAGPPIRCGGTWWWYHPDGRLSRRIQPPRDA
ncbi:hypothetical protein BKH29_05475 [Actinomyces oris]|uniref:Uncharacterized protein n=1 Tax=Actinomyces oris TaxID=544580 RepID=A0A1Q8V9Z2_9ACTO|nr:hypothetical protein BKH29_05475 [Actinomyces oris]